MGDSGGISRREQREGRRVCLETCSGGGSVGAASAASHPSPTQEGATKMQPSPGSPLRASRAGAGRCAAVLTAASVPRRMGLCARGAAWPLLGSTQCFSLTPLRMRSGLCEERGPHGPQGHAPARVPLLGCAWSAAACPLFGVHPGEVGLLSTCPAPRGPVSSRVTGRPARPTGTRGSGSSFPRGRGAVVTRSQGGGRAGADWGCCSVGWGSPPCLTRERGGH